MLILAKRHHPNKAGSTHPAQGWDKYLPIYAQQYRRDGCTSEEENGSFSRGVSPAMLRGGGRSEEPSPWLEVRGSLLPARAPAPKQTAALSNCSNQPCGWVSPVRWERDEKMNMCLTSTIPAHSQLCCRKPAQLSAV